MLAWWEQVSPRGGGTTGNWEMDASDIEALVIDRPEDGVFKVHADVYRSEEIFALEQKHIFEGGWVFLGLDCQAPKPHDFFTIWMGRQSVIVSRDGDGALHGLINACRHRGSLVCHSATGNARAHVCPYHGWTYDSAGNNTAVTGQDHGAYGAGFGAEEHGLRRIPRFSGYRGFLFASLNPDVPPLDDYLGETKLFIDLAVDQGPDGLETIPGTVHYTYEGNWKLQIENSADLYHFMPTHETLVKIFNARTANDRASDSPYRGRVQQDVTRGSMCFPHGHNVMFGGGDKVEARPLYRDLENLRRRVGEPRLSWMFHTRNVLFFPNMQLLENASLQIRVNRPVSAGCTEIVTHCVAPKGESDEARELRIRQYEEFFNPSGLATPDDTSIFEDIQLATQGDIVDWNQGYMRGMGAVSREPIEEARALGLSPTTSILGSLGLGDETILQGPIREWRDRLAAALRGERRSLPGHGAAAAE